MDSVLSLVMTVIVSITFLCILLLLYLRNKDRKSTSIESIAKDEFRINREEAARASIDLRQEIASSIKLWNDAVSSTMTGLGAAQQTSLDTFSRQLETTNAGYGLLREEVQNVLKHGIDTITTTLTGISQLQQAQLDNVAKQVKELTDSNQLAIGRVRDTIEAKLKEIQEGNEKKLEEMRKTVDEKLQGTLERRLGESFKMVGDRLEAVQKGLGEMQSLATGVGDLKKVLSNVKTRGTWAEVQLGSILEQILTPTQYEKNVQTKDGSNDHVEYAIRLPGPKSDPDSVLWLPIDSKFPQEDYIRLQDAAERSDPTAVQSAIDALTKAVRLEAKAIRDKYLDPPRTTDFGIMFLATEGLFAEVIRQPPLVEELYHTYRVIPAGPTTLAAIVSSLRMGFQTLAIEERASEVWKVLSAVKAEFAKFGDVLDKVKKQLATATKTIDETGVRTKAMARRLHTVEDMPVSEASAVLALPIAILEDDEENERPNEQEDIPL